MVRRSCFARAVQRLGKAQQGLAPDDSILPVALKFTNR
jgi:hypothetical protein